MKASHTNTLCSAALVISKIVEIFHWIAAGTMGVLLVCSLTFRNQLSAFWNSKTGVFGTSLTTYGFEVTAANPDGTVNMTAVTLFSVGAIISLSLFAMIFRNAYLILKTAKGNTWFSTGDTPFQGHIVRMLREIGIFLIAAALIGYVMSIVIRAAAGSEAVDISVRFDGIIIGLLVLCLSQFFAYGSELQKDVDGLV